MVVDGTTADVLLLLGRLLFGGVLAFMGANHFVDVQGMAGYAEAKGVPQPTVAVVGSGLLLLVGGLGVAAGIYPAVASALLVVFFVVTTPIIHNFWQVPQEQTQQEMTHFLKNTALLGASLAFLAFTAEEWAYAVGIGL